MKEEGWSGIDVQLKRRTDLIPNLMETVKGYMGHDEFAVVEGIVAQRFPIYKDGDTNAQPSGKMRQLQYKLEPGEASWQLRLDRVVDY